MPRWLVLLAALLALPAQAADPNRPHPHQGRLPAYKGEPPPLTLTPEEQAALDAGKPVFKQVDMGNRGRGVAVFLVQAPPEVIWSVIEDFPHYPQWVDRVERCTVYKREGDDIYVEFALDVPLVDVVYYIHHHYPTELGWGTWTLDYSRESDLDDSVGYWRVTPLPDRPGFSRVEYSVDVQVSGWVPDIIRDYLAEKGLEDATQWLKREAERKARGG